MIVSTPGVGITLGPNNCIRKFKSAVSIMSENGPYKLRNSENVVDRVGRSRMNTWFYFSLAIRGSANKDNKTWNPVGEER